MPDLQIERDDRFSARERTLHRVAVAVMAVVVIAGAAGVFGYGPLSSATASGTAFTVTYDRFARNGAPLTVEVALARGGADAQVWIDAALLDAAQIERVVPAPAEEVRTADGTSFVFDHAAAATFHLTSDAVGRVRGSAGLRAGEAVPVTIFFYP